MQTIRNRIKRTIVDKGPVPTTALLHQMLHRLSQEHPDLDVDAAELGDHLWSNSVRLVRAFEAHVQRYELTMARFGVLMNLLLAPGHQSTPSKISKSIHVSRPTMTGVIEGLVKTNLVCRLADPENRRNQFIKLTAEGLQFVERAAPDYFRNIAAAVLTLNLKERALLHSALDLMSRVEERIENGGLPEDKTSSAQSED